MENHEKNIEEKKKREEMKQEFFSSLRFFLVALAIALFLNTFIIVNARVPSGSMENTIQTGDRLIASRLAYLKEGPKRLDIVLFKFPDDEKKVYIKRVIGLPGETINIIDGKVYVDDDPAPLDDSFIAEQMRGSFGPFEVPEDCYFVMGDNRNDSWDSRFWDNTYVSRKKILGKALFRYWPLTQAGGFEKP